MKVCKRCQAEPVLEGAAAIAETLRVLEASATGSLVPRIGVVSDEEERRRATWSVSALTNIQLAIGVLTGVCVYCATLDSAPAASAEAA